MYFAQLNGINENKIGFLAVQGLSFFAISHQKWLFSAEMNHLVAHQF